MIINPLLYRQNLRALLLGIISLAVLHVFGVTYGLGLPIIPALTDASITWIIIGFIIFFITNTLSFHHPRSGMLYRVVLGSLIMAVICVKLVLWLSYISIRDETYYAFMESSGFYRLTVMFLIFTATTITSLLWYKLGEKQDALKRKEEMEKLARDAELFMLRQQLQPHFLFNSLNSISALIVRRPEEARTMVQQLSEFLRGTVKREDKKLANLKEELEYLKLYLDIEQVRFGHRLRVHIDCNEDIENWKLPPLILQPLMENAIKFGIYGTVGNIDIRLNCAVSENYLTLHITNPYDDDMQTPAGTGFGLKSVKRRLFLIYGRTDLLETKSENQVFTVSLKIPRTHDQSTAD